MSLAPLIAQGRVRPPRSTPRRRALVTAANQATFPFVPAAIGPLALILTVAAVQAVGAAIVLGSVGNRGLSCRGSSLRLIVITVIPRHPDKPHADG